MVEADDLDLIISGEGVTGVLREGLILDILGSVGLWELDQTLFGSFELKRASLVLFNPEVLPPLLPPTTPLLTPLEEERREDDFVAVLL